MSANNGANGSLRVPGVFSEEYLILNRVRHVDAEVAAGLVGFEESGMCFPYPGTNSTELIVDGVPFVRVRLDHPVNGAKYLQRRGTGAQVYMPCGPLFEDYLIICEGEKKALALCEAGQRAVAIGGITSAVHDAKLIPGLHRIIHKYKPKKVYFLGDSDTALNYDFSREAVKLAKLLPEGTGSCSPAARFQCPRELMTAEST